MIRRVLESPHYRWWDFAAIVLGNFFNSMEQGSLVIAIPSLSIHFDADIPTGQ